MARKASAPLTVAVSKGRECDHAAELINFHSRPDVLHRQIAHIRRRSQVSVAMARALACLAFDQARAA